MNQRDKQALDRHLTTEPEDEYLPLIELIIDEIMPAIYNKHHQLFEGNEVVTGWYRKLIERGWHPEKSARLLERAVSLYHRALDREGVLATTSIPQTITLIIEKPHKHPPREGGEFYKHQSIPVFGIEPEGGPVTCCYDFNREHWKILSTNYEIAIVGWFLPPKIKDNA